METTAYNLIQALGWSMLHSIWFGAIAYLLVSLFHFINPKQRSSQKYNLAYGLQIALFLGFILSFIHYYGQAKAVNNEFVIDPQQLTVYLLSPKEHVFGLEGMFPYFSIVYIVGFSIQLFILVNSYLRLRKLKYKGLDSIPSTWTSLFERAKSNLGIQRRVSLFLSNHINVPLTVGFIRPFVLFPIAYVNQLNSAQVEAILLHELAHIKRNDYLFNLIKVVIETILFFNPFIWAISRVIEREREHACDDMVLAQIGNPLPYAKALVELEELRKNSTPALSLAATGKKNHLFQRIKRITKMETNHRNVKQQLIAVLASSIALICIAMLIPAQESKAQEKQVDNRGVEVPEPNVPRAPIPAVAKVQVDTIKKPNQVIHVNHHVVEDTTILPPAIRQKLRSIQMDSKEMAKHTNSPEFKAQMQKIKTETDKVSAYFQSDEWKEKMKAINLSNAEISKLISSQKWKDMPAKDVQKYFESKEWKDAISKLQNQTSKMTTEYFESDAWKNQIAAINSEAAKIKDHFNSPAWKEQVKRMEEAGKEVDLYFKSAEWKQKEKEMKELYDSKEYQEIQERYERDLEQLKKERTQKRTSTSRN